MRIFLGFLVTIVATCLFGCASPGSASLLRYEIRVPVDAPLPDETRINFVTPSRIGSRPLPPSTNGQNALIYTGADLIYRERYRAIVVELPKAPAQVFVLRIPRTPWLSDWKEWQKADYLDTSESPAFNVMDQGTKNTRQPGPGDPIIEVRCRVEQWPHHFR